MFLKIKSRINAQLRNYITGANKVYSLNNLSPLLFNSLKEFVLRDGKRVRPILFCLGYLGYASKRAPGLFQSAVSLELLHDFLLIHDDIIDKSGTRRGKPSMHVLLNTHLNEYKRIKFNGTDLAIVAGDALYALAMDAFLSIKEEPLRKELALKKFISTALFTAGGEFIELLLGAKPIQKVSKADIYKIYDYKTANYTFSSPLVMGALLAGASSSEIKKLSAYGIYLGRAFQIKDDIIGTFGNESETGKSNLTDLKEAKITLLIWFAFNHAGAKDKTAIIKLFNGKAKRLKDLKNMRCIIKSSGALNYALKEIDSLISKAQSRINALTIRDNYRKTLQDFSKKILALQNENSYEN